MNKPVYANPMQPDICPFLALSVLVLSTYHGSESVYVFGDSEQNAEKKFETWFHTVMNGILDDDDPDLVRLKKGLFGKHSYRKGSATLVASSATCGIISLFLRAGWSVGQVLMIPYLVMIP